MALAACGVAVSDLWELRGGRPQRARVDVRRAAASLHSRDYLRLDGGPGPLGPATGNPLVDFYRCRDGRWVHVHGALSNLAYGTMRVLGCARERESVAAAVAGWDGEALENALAQAGQCGAMVRTAEEWAAHPQGRALADRPRVEIVKLGESEPEPLPAGERPLSGVRVLDLTRILAGPSHARTLAEHGADVLYIASPWLPNPDAFVMDTNHGKLSAFLDLDQPDDATRLRELIRHTDVFAQGYRAGSLARRGFGPDELADAAARADLRVDQLLRPRGPLGGAPGLGAARPDGHRHRGGPGPARPTGTDAGRRLRLHDRVPRGAGHPRGARPTRARRRQLSRARLALSERDVVRPPRARPATRPRRAGPAIRRSSASRRTRPSAGSDISSRPSSCPRRRPTGPARPCRSAATSRSGRTADRRGRRSSGGAARLTAERAVHQPPS